MRAVFIADAHLRCKESPRYRAVMGFLHHLRGIADGGSSEVLHGSGGGYGKQAAPLLIDRLYILGDFFDFWFERSGTIYPDFEPVISRLVTLKEQGVRIFLAEGNHDFFLDEYFTRALGMMVLPEWAEFEMDGRRILVSHGDTVDRNNKSYLFMRSLLRSGFFQRLQAVLPLPLLWGVARTGSTISKDYSRVPPDTLCRRMRTFSGEKFTEGYDAVILGHCHIPKLEERIINGRTKTFVTLGDWIEHCTYLAYADGRFTLFRYHAAEGSSERYENGNVRNDEVCT